MPWELDQLGNRIWVPEYRYQPLPTNSGGSYQTYIFGMGGILGQQGLQANQSFTQQNLQNIPTWTPPEPSRHPQGSFTEYIKRERKILGVEESEDDDMAGKGYTGMINNFMVGCDPEFVALNARGETMLVSNHFGSNGEIGYDHGGRVGELRPEPTRGTYALLKKLHRLINSPQITRMNPAKLRAGAVCNREVLGGHVHFGFTVPRMEINRTTGDSEMPVQVRALDRVTKVLENLDILPKDESVARRRGGHYGRWGDIRDSGGHLEYRTMASWLYDPRIAYTCLTAAKLAASDPQGTVNNLKESASFSDLTEWFRRYRTKDINARRAIERVLDKTLKDIQVYPDVNFRERWVALGL